MSEQLSLGGLIRRQRAELGLTQARLAELVGKSPSTVRGWERDRTVPADPSSLAALAAVLGISDDELGAATGEPTTPEETEPVLREAIQLPVTPPPDAIKESEEPAPAVSSTEELEPIIDPPEAYELPEENPESIDELNIIEAEVGAIESLEVDVAAVPETFEADEVDESAPDPSVPESPITEIPVPEPVVDRRREQQAELPTAVSPAMARLEREGPKPVVDRQTSAVSARARVPSYLDDQNEIRTYRVRILLTAVVMVFLFIVLTWAFGEAGDALGSLFKGPGPDLR